jgi:hypothetical protein
MQWDRARPLPVRIGAPSCVECDLGPIGRSSAFESARTIASVVLRLAKLREKGAWKRDTCNVVAAVMAGALLRSLAAHMLPG